MKNLNSIQSSDQDNCEMKQLVIIFIVVSSTYTWEINCLIVDKILWNFQIYIRLRNELWYGIGNS